MLILAGGRGTRLRSVLPDLPKGLAPIGPYPFLEIQIRQLSQQGARRFVLCVGHQSARIQAALGDGRRWGVHIEYSVERKDRLLGTAGALKLAEHYFVPRALVLNGDTYFAISYSTLVKFHLREWRRCGVLATLALSRVPERARYGSVVLDRTGRYVRAFLEKQDDATTISEWVSAGAYVVERGLLECIPHNELCSLERDVFPGSLESGRRLGAITFGGRFFDIGTPDGLRTFTDFFTGGPVRKASLRMNPASHVAR